MPEGFTLRESNRLHAARASGKPLPQLQAPVGWLLHRDDVGLGPRQTQAQQCAIVFEPVLEWCHGSARPGTCWLDLVVQRADPTLPGCQLLAQ